MSAPATAPDVLTRESLPELLERLARALHHSAFWSERNLAHQRHTRDFAVCHHADCERARAVVALADGLKP